MEDSCSSNIGLLSFNLLAIEYVLEIYKYSMKKDKSEVKKKGVKDNKLEKDKREENLKSKVEGKLEIIKVLQRESFRINISQYK